MASWNPEVMRISKMKIDEALGRMEELNKELVKKVLVFEANVQDEIVTNTKTMIQEINTLISDIKDKVETQINKMEKAAEGISKLEATAEDRIKSIK